MGSDFFLFAGCRLGVAMQKLDGRIPELRSSQFNDADRNLGKKALGTDVTRRVPRDILLPQKQEASEPLPLDRYVEPYSGILLISEI